eukprot:CAMPEP_0195154838 /NCGR_PEP_ID=MMETSP0448-20130528/183856_1 /TAXON_ID=66468 /ORGANISM="Heterocapsa triquestra, Strain CCMP 448" /LENGTH=392 /DNA_ID=CAMNT_0040193619 /DNA_START=65 /DNA_END=1240 /DNA_ORIENTATION=+
MALPRLGPTVVAEGVSESNVNFFRKATELIQSDEMRRSQRWPHRADEPRWTQRGGYDADPCGKERGGFGQHGWMPSTGSDQSMGFMNRNASLPSLQGALPEVKHGGDPMRSSFCGGSMPSVGSYLPSDATMPMAPLHARHGLPQKELSRSVDQKFSSWNKAGKVGGFQDALDPIGSMTPMQRSTLRSGMARVTSLPSLRPEHGGMSSPPAPAPARAVEVALQGSPPMPQRGVPQQPAADPWAAPWRPGGNVAADHVLGSLGGQETSVAPPPPQPAVRYPSSLPGSEVSAATSPLRSPAPGVGPPSPWLQEKPERAGQTGPSGSDEQAPAVSAREPPFGVCHGAEGCKPPMVVSCVEQPVVDLARVAQVLASQQQQTQQVSKQWQQQQQQQQQ